MNRHGVLDRSLSYHGGVCRWFTCPLLILALSVATGLPAHAGEADASAAVPVPAPVPVPALEPGEAREILVFADGDRTRGKLIGRDGDMLVFQSVRFGELRVPAASATVEAAPVVGGKAVAADGTEPARLQPYTMPPSLPAGEAVVVGPAGAPVEMTPPGIWTSPAALLQAAFRFLGPWKGRFALSASLRNDTSSGEEIGVDLGFSRKWQNDEAKFESRYYFSRTDNATVRDLLKGNGLLRHDFRGPYFISYRPTAEWNRNHKVNGVAAVYVLTQEAIGIGVNLIDRKDQKVGLGVAENVFNLWTLSEESHSVRGVQSLFGEFDFSLPWRITIAGRGTWFYSLSTGDRGWEDQLEVKKMFSDTLSLGLRREARHNNPDRRIADYSLFRLQLGFDF